MVNSDTGQVITALPITEGCDGVEFDPKSKTIFAATYSGVISTYLEKSKNEFVALAEIKTESGARTLAIDVKTQKIYLPTAEYGTVENPVNHRLTVKDGTFHILEIGK